MKVFISADMEGITGVAAPADVVTGEPEYERGTELLHGDVNAAVAGAFEAGAEAVLVNDSHSSMRNLDRDRLDDRADLIRGNTKPRSMM
ncbi:MAG: M55 family metallopeptidase, partial [Halolamina sp.]